MIKKILTDKDLNSNEKIILIYLIEKWVNSKISIPFKIMAEELGLTPPTIIKGIKGLECKGLVIKEHNFNNGVVLANTHKINISKYN